MKRRAPTLLALWSILLAGVFLISSLPTDGSVRDDIQLQQGEQTVINIGRPEFELNNERIDIIPYSSNPELFVTRALAPAKVLEIDI